MRSFLLEPERFKERIGKYKLAGNIPWRSINLSFLERNNILPNQIKQTEIKGSISTSRVSTQETLLDTQRQSTEYCRASYNA